MIAHAELDDLLRRAGASVDAAECHGTLCGTLCVPGGDSAQWLAGVMEGRARDALPVVETRKALQRLATGTRGSLRDAGAGFTPLLPDDESPLGDRVAALGEWCDGFVHGLGTTGLQGFDALSPDAQEFIRDVVEIARVGVPAGQGEDDEVAYTELVEYLRVGVQLLYTIMHPGQGPAELEAPPGVH